MKISIAILMATYNGQDYLEDQISSILHQDYADWRLIIRDDLSNDKTPEIIQKYCERDERVMSLNDGLGNLGPKGNFEALMNFSCNKYEYFLFCDQDDVWKKDKIRISLNALKEVESSAGMQMPILTYTDFTYVDINLDPLALQIDFGRGSNGPGFNRLFVQNYVYGCTTFFNNALMKRCLSIPDVFENHDYWIAFVAAATGKIIHIPYASLWYRQHEMNATSVYASASFKGRMAKLVNGNSFFARDISIKNGQVFEIYKLFYGSLSVTDQDLITNYIKKWRGSKILLIFFMIRHGIYKMRFFQSLVLFYFIIVLRKSRLNRAFSGAF